MTTTAVQSILKSVFRKPEDKLDILVFCHKRLEQYVSLLSKLNHNFFLWTEEYNGGWTNSIIDKPSNVYHLPNQQSKFDMNLIFDLVIANSRFAQYDITKNISIGWHIPQIVVHHDDLNGMVIDDFSKEAFLDQNKITELLSRVGDINIFDSQGILQSWNTIGQVISPGVDNKFYKYNENLIEGILFNTTDSYKFNPAIGYIISNRRSTQLKYVESEENLREEYYNHSIFLNFDTVGINPLVLKAMACGLTVVCYPNRHITDVIKNGINGFIVNNDQEMKSVIDQIYSNKNLTNQIGKNARQTVEEKFNILNFLNDWNSVLSLATTMIYTR